MHNQILLNLWQPDAIVSVSAYTQHLKHILEGQIPPTWIRGEVSNLKIQSSGHIYFTLKDTDSQISVVLFKGAVARQNIRLADGLRILVYGEISLYTPRGTYQLIARCLLEEGQGQLSAAFERLKQKLSQEGLFDAQRKKPMPILPRVIGIVTSPTGAAVQDFLSILHKNSWKGKVYVLGCKVQGVGALQELVHQIQRASCFPGLDLLVIARGGGSVEDLWHFNEELVVRTVAECSCPTISAIGHEIDFTLCDFVADYRAPTPSAAAAWVVQAQAQASEHLATLYQSMNDEVDRYQSACRQLIALYKQQLKAISPAWWIENRLLKLDELLNRLEQAWGYGLSQARNRLGYAQTRFQAMPIRSMINQQIAICDRLKKQHVQVWENRIKYVKNQLDHLKQRLACLNIDRVLERGFVYLQDQNGHYLSKKAHLSQHAPIIAHFQDGTDILWPAQPSAMGTDAPH